MNDVLNLFTEYDVDGAFWVNSKLTFWLAVIATILGVLLIMMRKAQSRPCAVSQRDIPKEFFKNMPLKPSLWCLWFWVCSVSSRWASPTPRY